MTGPSPADPVARSLLAQVGRLGYRVSTHYPDASLRGMIPVRVEYHAVVAETGEQHVTYAPANGPDAELRAAAAPAESVGIGLEG